MNFNNKMFLPPFSFYLCQWKYIYCYIYIFVGVDRWKRIKIREPYIILYLENNTIHLSHIISNCKIMLCFKEWEKNIFSLLFSLRVHWYLMKWSLYIYVYLSTRGIGSWINFPLTRHVLFGNVRLPSVPLKNI